jgi:hypothetical protein
MMDRDVYTDPVVAEYMNANFVNVRMDGETDFGRTYAAEQKLQGYPSMFIFSDEGDPVSSIVGFRPADLLVTELKGMVDNYAQVKRYRSGYEKGTLSRTEFASYVAVVRSMGNDQLAEELAGEYMKQGMDESLNEGDIQVVAHYTDLEDPWWPQFTSEVPMVKRSLGADYLPALEKIYNNTLVKAVDKEDIGLISRMSNELSPLVEAEQDVNRDLRTLPFLQYYYYTGQNNELLSYVDSRYTSDRMGDHGWLFGAASQIVDMDQQYQTQEIMAKAESWFAECLTHEETYDYVFYLGMVQLFQRRPEEAKDAFNRAKGLASTPEETQMVDQVLRYVSQ